MRKVYDEKIVPALIKELQLGSVMAAPKLEKIVINMGVNEAKENIQVLEQAKEDLTAITGQMPETMKAKKSISNFKLREGMPIALRVTLRGAIMYEFLDRFISLSAPKIRDFQGFSSGHFDGRGNYNVGLRDHHIFPEVNVEKSVKSRGMNITFVLQKADNHKGHLLLEHFGMPFKKEKSN
ncbi:MAG: 50S ribosomal protein L5 [Elusimicrobia bacterium CG08_land_8_20_14_0_20_51_18]|nr:MAG: 50S ribosomal protein L5 [Elusimicrobia bacterium CG08_land_8_20_14_0_20_51_18]